MTSLRLFSNVIKGKIKAQWGKLTDDEIEIFKGNLDQITGTIQQAHGHAKEKSEADFQDFKRSISDKL